MNYIFQLFNSHNTCIEQENPMAKSVGIAREIARRLSFNYIKVILNGSNGWFEQYEKGEKTEWSAQ